MAINGVGHNYDYLGTTTNYIRGKATVREAISKMVKQSANLSISDAEEICCGKWQANLNPIRIIPMSGN